MTQVILVMVGMPMLYIIIDIGLAVNKRKGDTFSEILRDAAKKFLPLAIMMAFGWGLLCGHWFWSPVEYVEVPCKEADDG